MRVDAQVDIGLRNEATARSEGDDNHGNFQTATELVQCFGREGVQGFLGEHAPGVKRGSPQQCGAGGTLFHEGGEFALIGDEHLGVSEHPGVELWAHRRGVEDSDGAVAAGGAQHIADGGVVGLPLADHHLGGREHGSGDIPGLQSKIGAERDDDLVLAGAVDSDDGGAGGVLGLLDKMSVQAGIAGERPDTVGGAVGPDRADEEGGNACARRGDGLVETLAPGPGPELAHDGLARSRKILGVES